MPTRAEHIRGRIQFALDAERVEVHDESHLHAGHAGARSGGESHFRALVVAARFEGKSQVERQRMVYDLLAEEMSGGIHALSIKAITPDECDKV